MHRVVGRAGHWRYTFLLPIGERRWSFTVDDWMLLQDTETLFNRATFSKFGIEVGHVVIVFQRLPETASRSTAPAEGAVLAAAE